MSCYSHPDHQSKSGEFAIHPGPAHLHSPLGHSSLETSHYIVPSPRFTTEYEDAFQDRTVSSPNQDQTKSTDVLPEPSISLPTSTSKWLNISRDLKKVLDLEFEVELIQEAMAQVENRRLGEYIERAVTHLEGMKGSPHLSQELRAAISDFLDSVGALKG